MDRINHVKLVTPEPEIVDAFLDQEWSNAERHQRRIDILSDYERTGEAPVVPNE